jgi:hypothetical protein
MLDRPIKKAKILASEAAPFTDLRAAHTLLETSVLCACSAEPRALTIRPDVSALERLAIAKASQRLVSRGFLAKMKDGLLVTPEGLAALLDTVPVTMIMKGATDLVCKLSQASVTQVIGLLTKSPRQSGASKRPSTARRRSAKPRARRVQAPS